MINKALKFRHSRWCQYKNHTDDEPLCSCGHPKCLHQEVSKMTILGRYEPCRSKDCEGMCEGYYEESK